MPARLKAALAPPMPTSSTIRSCTPKRSPARSRSRRASTALSWPEGANPAVPYTSRIKWEKIVALLAARRTIRQLACQASANSPLTAEEGPKLDGLRKALDMERNSGIVANDRTNFCTSTAVLSSCKNRQLP